jgi:hypothetical protein
MDIRQALKEQYHAGLAMLADCVEKCPEDVWLAGEHPRTFWRVACHTTYFALCYLVQTEDDFDASGSAWPPAVREALGLTEGRPATHVEPYELPEGVAAMTRGTMLEYIAYVRGLVDMTVDGLDLDTDKSGFPWYPNTAKLSHELLNLRHIQGHVGQLSELLMAKGIDTNWISTASSSTSR